MQREICPHDEYCGGCLHQGTEYPTQKLTKGQEVVKLLEKSEIDLSNLLIPFEAEQLIGAPCAYAYRNKMEYTFGDMQKGGEMTLGMHQKGRFMSIVTVDQCQLVHEDFNLILSAVLTFCREKGYNFYHKKTHKGLVRHLIVRKGMRTGEILVNIVTTDQEYFDEAGFADKLLNLQNKLLGKLAGILRTTNNNIADAVYNEGLTTIWGRDYYMEKIMDLDFKVSAFSFFQTNIEAAERLYIEAISMIDDFSGKTVFDLFCGTGTITQAMAVRAHKAVGVELIEEAVLAAKENAELNNLSNCNFIAGDVFDVLDTIEEKPDVIVVDPPRVGIAVKTLEKILAYGVDQILYISCNPKTMVENLRQMQYKGYKVKDIKAYDNFPMTKHIECVCLLEKEKL